MRYKVIFVNLLISLISIYTPLFFYTLYRYKSDFNKKFYMNIANAKISAAKNGYLPVFTPELFFKKNDIPKSYPVGSLPLKPSYFCSEGYGLITFKTDRFGLRNKDKNWENIINKSNIFIIGDSFVQGACVPQDSTISSQLRKEIGLNTINLGTGGNGPYEYQALIKSIVTPIIRSSKKGNTIILVFYPNDDNPLTFIEKRERLLKSTSSIINFNLNGDVIPKKKYLNDTKMFLKNNYNLTKEGIIEQIYKTEKNKLNSFKNSSFYYIFSLQPIRSSLKVLFLTSKLKSNPISNEEKNSPSIEVISYLAEICNDLCKPIIAYIPQSNYWSRHILKIKANKYKKDLIEASIQNNILFVDGEEVINSDNIHDYAPKGGHLSIAGYEKFSDLLNKNIKN